MHRVIKFKQKAIFKPYIMMNTELRMNANNEFERAFFKLMNNSGFGKTTENVRNYRDIKLVTTERQRRRLESQPNFQSCVFFSENLMEI